MDKGVGIWKALILEVHGFGYAENTESYEQFALRMEAAGYSLQHTPPDEKQSIFTGVIEYLNQQAGTQFRTKYPSSNSVLILARIQEGYTKEDLIQVIDNKCRQWLNTDQEKYLRPETLFSQRHFENYLGEKITHGTTTGKGVSGNDIDRFTSAVASAKGALSTNGGE